MKEIRNTLENVELTNERQSGNSTRQINLAIDLLFKGYIVEVKDHFQNGTNKKLNKFLFKLILRRLEIEHSYMIKRIKINKNKLTLELI